MASSRDAHLFLETHRNATFKSTGGPALGSPLSPCSGRMQNENERRQLSVLHSRPMALATTTAPTNSKHSNALLPSWPLDEVQRRATAVVGRCRHRHQAAVDGVHLSAESGDESILADGCSLLAAIEQRASSTVHPSASSRCPLGLGPRSRPLPPPSLRFDPFWLVQPPTELDPPTRPFCHTRRRTSCTFGGLQPFLF